MGKLVRCISEDGTLLIMACDTTDIVTDAHEIHGTSKVCTAALGRLLTAGAMMGSMLKGKKDTLTLKINGGGPAGSVLTVADSDCHVKGYVVDGNVELPLNSKGKLDVGGAVGKNGFVTVIKDLGLKEPFVGQVLILPQANRHRQYAVSVFLWLRTEQSSQRADSLFSFFPQLMTA